MATSQDLLNADLNLATLDGVVTSNAESVNNRLGQSNLTLAEIQRRSAAAVAAAGFVPVAGSFEAGGTITERNQVLQRTTSPAAYFSWGGTLPKVVPASSTVAGTGGEGVTAWTNRNDGTLAAALADGTANVGGVTSELLGSRASQWAVVTDPEFGADPTGVALSSLAFIAAQNSSDFIVVPPGTYNMSLTDVVRIFSGKTWFFMGCEFIKAPGNARMFEAVFEFDFNLLGSATFRGNATESDIQNNENFTGETALYIESCARYKVGDLNFRNIAGYGLKMSGVTGATPYFGERGRFGFLSGSVCHFGMDLDAGNGSEYNVFTGYDFSANRVGLRMGAGNNVFAGGSITGNRYANVWLTGGRNNGHGSMVATTINHAGVYNLFVDDVTVGFSFGDCQFFGNAPDSSSGQIFIRNSKGITINGGILDCWVSVFGGVLSGNHKISNMWCAGSYGTVKVYDEIDLPPTNMIIDGCYGPGSFNAVTGSSINSPEAMTILSRGPSGGQSLTLGVYAVLQFTDAFKLTDDRRAWNAANSSYTVPSEAGGIFNINARLTFQTTGTIDIKTSRVRVLVNGAASNAVFRAYSKAAAADDTDIISVSVDTNLLLKPSDTIQFEALIAGTGTPVFSDPNGRMFVTIEKKK